MIKVDISNVWGEISLPDLLAVEKEVAAAHSTLTEQTGPGNDFLGWLDLPVEEPTEEMIRIQAAADRIRENSDVFVVIGIGALFSVLAFFMLVMSILLLIEKNKEKIANLFAMGYSAKKAASAYILLAVTVDVAVWAFAALLATIVYPGFSGMISDVSPGFAPAALWIIWFAATIMALLFVVMHGIVIQRRVNGICRFN